MVTRFYEVLLGESGRWIVKSTLTASNCRLRRPHVSKKGKSPEGASATNSVVETRS